MDLSQSRSGLIPVPDITKVNVCKDQELKQSEPKSSPQNQKGNKYNHK